MLTGTVIHTDLALRVLLHVPTTAQFYAADVDYAQVNSQWVQKYWSQWRDATFARGLIRWNDWFDCNKFADLFVIDAQLAYAKRGRKVAESLAVGVLHYRPSMVWGATADHAIVVFLTEKGRIYMDPQNGEIMNLTDQEIKNTYYVRL